MAGVKKYPKKPKAPRKSASLSVHESYHARYSEWEKKCKEIDKHNTKVKAAQKKTDALRNKR